MAKLSITLRSDDSGLLSSDELGAPPHPGGFFFVCDLVAELEKHWKGLLVARWLKRYTDWCDRCGCGIEVKGVSSPQFIAGW